MTKVSLATIKSWFLTGSKPTQTQFGDTWDSYRHKDDAVAMSDVTGLTASLDLKLDAGVFNIIPRTSLLAEYRFDEGSGSTLVDYSGNGKNGSYVGSPTFIAGGGFTAAGTTSPSKYATGHTDFLLTAQTIYFAYSIDPDSTSTYHPIIGNSAGLTNMNISQSPVTNNTQFPSAQVYGGTGPGSGGACYSNDVIPLIPAILAVTIDGSNVIQSQIFIEGKEVLSYNTRSLNIASGRVGTPWFGGTNTGTVAGTFNGNIYYAASYSALHTSDQIAKISTIIRNLLNARGTAKPNVYQPSTLTAQLVALGDSITAMLGTGGATPYMNLINTRLTFNKYIKGWPGVAGQSIYAAPGLSSLYYAPNGSYNIAVIFLGANVIGNKALYQAAFEAIQSAAQCFKKNGWKVLVLTIMDQNTSISYMDSLNGLIRSGFTRDEVVDIAADPRLGAAGASNNTTYFQTDKLHPTTAGQQIIADYLSAKINRLTIYGKDTKTLYLQIQTATVTNTTTETSIVGLSSVNDIEFNNSVSLANYSSGSTTIGSVFTTQLVVGQAVSGTGIPANTTISSITDNTHLVISQNTTAAGSNLPLTFSKIGMKRHFFTPGQSIVIDQKGLLSTGAAQTLNRKVKFGSTVAGATGVVTLPSSVTNVFYKMNVEITCISIGTSGTFQVQGELTVYDGAGGHKIYPIINTSVVTLDTTADYIIDITDTWGAASASNIDISTNLSVSRLR